jgi:hypothetical protein
VVVCVDMIFLLFLARILKRIKHLDIGHSPLYPMSNKEYPMSKLGAGLVGGLC